MGLDMYAYKLRADLAPADDKDLFRVAREAVGFEEATDQDLNGMTPDERIVYWKARDVAQKKAAELGIFDGDFCYWRKFNELHGWMEDLYASRGGESDFNCIPIRLYPDDLDKLEADFNAGNLTSRSGFFWGEAADEEEMQEVPAFIKKARQAIADGYAVYYDSWW